MIHPDFLPLNSRQISDWRAFSQIHAIGDDRDDLRAALASWKICHSLGSTGELSKHLLPEKSSPMTRDDLFLQRMRNW